MPKGVSTGKEEDEERDVLDALEINILFQELLILLPPLPYLSFYGAIFSCK